MTTIHPRVTSSATISKKPRKDKIAISFFVFIIGIGGLGILLRSGTMKSQVVHARAATKFAKRAQLNYYYKISTVANRNIIEPFECVAKLVEYRRTPRHLQVITGPRLTNQQMIIGHLEELIENERIIAAIITPAVNVVQEQFHDHSSSQTQRDFIQSKRECMGSFVGVDDESDEDENIV